MDNRFDKFIYDEMRSIKRGQQHIITSIDKLPCKSADSDKNPLLKISVIATNIKWHRAFLVALLVIMGYVVFK